MQATVPKTKFRRQPVSSNKTTKGKSGRGEPKLARQSFRCDPKSDIRNPTKRTHKDKCQHERVVRFRSTDEEYVFEVDSVNTLDVPVGSDVFQTTLKEMKENFASGIDHADDDDVFDCVFKATVTLGKTENRSPIKKPTSPGKSILKRRTSLRR